MAMSIEIQFSEPLRNKNMKWNSILPLKGMTNISALCVGMHPSLFCSCSFSNMIYPQLFKSSEYL